ncbi:hypothetical protein B296_00019537 [Ensete ventricosum]|uniref:Uncharacterized protein n=1 Tax=Ensete ventricosum TaxID=4639 RepID=A0A426Z7A4_ENSVE|nr:hypothetical protein B296_00019537 [Ensete ventricosum]
MQLGTRLECVGNSPRVSGACQDGAREFTERRSRLIGRLSEVAKMLAESWEVVVPPRSVVIPPLPVFRAAFNGGVAGTGDGTAHTDFSGCV